MGLEENIRGTLRPGLKSGPENVWVCSVAECAEVPRNVRERKEAGLGRSGPLSEFRSSPGPDWLLQHLPQPFPAAYNAGDYAEGAERPSGCLARCTYKGAIEMCSHSKSQAGWRVKWAG